MEGVERVVIVGSGNLAEALARAIARAGTCSGADADAGLGSSEGAGSDAQASPGTGKGAGSGLRLVQLFARNAERGRAVAVAAGTAWESDPEKLAEADIYLIAVSDKAVGEVAAALRIPAEGEEAAALSVAADGEGTAGLSIPPSAIVAHTAGSVPLDVLPARFAHRAVFYPLQTFTAGRAVDFAQVPILLEAGDEACKPALERFARRLSQRVLWVDSARRAQVHLAAVFACNFANHMYVLGQELLDRAGLPFDVLKPLIAETAAKACDAASPVDVQTGPAVRGDERTRARHCVLLDDRFPLKNIYTLISNSIWETSKKR